MAKPILDQATNAALEKSQPDVFLQLGSPVTSMDAMARRAPKGSAA